LRKGAAQIVVAAAVVVVVVEKGDVAKTQDWFAEIGAAAVPAN
jgi:hypothetical protein